MATARRFNATPETILRDLAITLGKMRAADPIVALGGRLSQELTRNYQRRGVRVETLQLDLAPSGAAIAFNRAGQRYRFDCVKYEDGRDNLRAAQLAVTLLWRVQEDYGVSEGREAQESFDRLFGGHRLALGDGATGDEWHEVLPARRSWRCCAAPRPR